VGELRLSGELGNGAQDNPDGRPGLRREGAVHQLVGLQLPERFVFERVEADLDLAIPVVAEFGREVFELVLESLFSASEASLDSGVLRKSRIGALAAFLTTMAGNSLRISFGELPIRVCPLGNDRTR
jgi:hypothetical protein